MAVPKFIGQPREGGNMGGGGRKPLPTAPKDRTGSSVPMGKRTAKRRLKNKQRKQTKQRQRH